MTELIILLFKYGYTVNTELSDVPETGIVYTFPLESNISSLMVKEMDFLDMKVTTTTISVLLMPTLVP
jgi:hypothetical protein